MTDTEHNILTARWRLCLKRSTERVRLCCMKLPNLPYELLLLFRQPAYCYLYWVLIVKQTLNVVLIHTALILIDSMVVLISDYHVVLQ